MLRLVGVLAVLASCGRFGFDDTRTDATLTGDGSGRGDSDGAEGHDEDGDGIPDTADFCPHIADPANGDGDGDLVGDACDPLPGTASESWVLFAPMLGDEPELAHGSEWTLNDDYWDFVDSANPAQLIRTGTLANIDVWVGFDVTVVGTGGVQAAIVLRDGGGGTPYNYAELFDGGTGARLSIMEYDGANYNVQSTTSLDSAFPLGEGVLHLQARPANTFTLRYAALMTTAPTPSYATAMFTLIGFGNHSGRVRYVAIVESQ